jgi:tape measure domain-containing protein
VAEIVGGIAYTVSLDTRPLVAAQRDVDREVRRTAGTLDQFESKLNAITRAVGAYAAALFVVRQADAFTKLTAQLKLATDSTEQLADAQARVRQIATEAQTEITSVGTLYARVSTATKELGISQSRVAEITRAVALSLKISNAGAQESASAMLQLSQAFASGVFRGEEFNAVAEAAPRLMKALADGIGRPVGELRAMAEAGQLTADVLAAALPKALGDLEREAAQVRSISGAFQQLRNEVLLFIGEQTTASGAARATADAITALASNIDVLIAAAYGYAATKLARLMLDVSINAAQSAKAMVDNVAAHQASRAAAIADAKAKIDSIAATQAGIVVAREEMAAKLASANASLQAATAQAAAARSAGALSFALAAVREAELQAAAATKARSLALAELAILGQQQARITAAMTAAQAAQTAAITATGTAATLASRALGLLGGPIGAITTLLGIGATAWMVWGDSANAAETKAADAIERSTEDIVADLDRQIAKLKERNRLATAGLPGIAKQDNDATGRLATLQRQIDNLMAGNGPDGGAALPEAARVDLLQKLLGQYGQLAGRVAAVADEQERLAAVGQASKLSEWMAKYATDAERANAEVAKAKKELGGAFTPELEQRIRQKYLPKPAKPQDVPGLDRDYIGEAEARVAQKIEDWRSRNELALDKLDEDTLRRSAEAQAKGREMAVQAILDADPVAKLEAELQAKSALLADYAAIDQENLALYAEARVALEEQTAQRIAEIQERRRIEEAAAQAAVLQNYGSLFGSMSDVVKTFAGEQSRTYQALFAVSKAFAIAEAIIKIQQGIANAASLPFPANLGAMATVAASTAGIVATIQGTQFGGGRQYGGPTSAGTLYRVNEGGRPEMFTARNGAQYMLPTADGNVTPASAVGGGRGGITINQTVNVSSGVNRAEVAQAVAQGNRALVAELTAQGVL